MIKFVCASCGERLSVPDTHGGRRCVCPVCQAVSRIPLRGFAETQPDAPVIARPGGTLHLRALGKPGAFAGELAQPTSTPFGVLVEPPEATAPAAPSTASTTIALEPAPLATAPDGPVSMAPAASAAGTARPEPVISSSPATSSPDTATQLDSIAPPPVAPAMNHVTLKPIASAPARTASAAVRREWRLPMAIKVFLLIVFAISLVGSLYLGLFWIVRSLKDVP